MQRNQVKFLYLNLGHFMDHLFMLVFASVAAMRLTSEWGMSYAQLIPYATPGFVAFGVCAILAGWIADKWSREGMIVIFFIGIGISSIISAMANSPVQIAVGLTLIGIFAAIYHPVGLAMVVHGRAPEMGGLDELTPVGVNRVSHLRQGQIQTVEIDGQSLGFAAADLDLIRVQSPQASAQVVEGVLAGRPGPARDIVCLNAAAVLVVAGVADDLARGVLMAAQAIDERQGADVLAKLVRITQGQPVGPS
jgi:hypothetical protein